MQDPFEELETYHDNAIDRFFISYFAKKMSKQLGGMNTCSLMVVKHVTHLKPVLDSQEH